MSTYNLREHISRFVQTDDHYNPWMSSPDWCEGQILNQN